jgi:hypothetical protein
MNKHQYVSAEAKVPKSEMIEMDQKVLRDRVISDLIHGLVDTVARETCAVTLQQSDDIDELATIWRASMIVINVDHYRAIVDVIRKHNYNVTDKDGNIITLSELL